MATTRLSTLVGKALGTALLLAVLPSAAEAQERRPSIRISAGNVFIGGRHAGFTGTARNPHATGILIRDRLHRMGDPRFHRFGPHRLGPHRFGHGHLLVPKRFHRHRHFRHHRDLLFHPHGHHPHVLGHHPGHVFVVFGHPVGIVALGWHVGFTRTVRTAGTSVAVGGYPGAPVEDLRAPPVEDPEAPPVEPGFPQEAPRAPPRPPQEPPPPERCADVTVLMVAGAVQTVRLDVESLGAESVDEADELLRARLATGGGLLQLRGAYGDGLSVPVSLVRGVTVEACLDPEEESER